jgi:hypothetical protein
MFAAMAPIALKSHRMTDPIVDAKCAVPFLPLTILRIVPPSLPSPPYYVIFYNFRIARDPYAANVRLVLVIVCRSRTVGGSNLSGCEIGGQH